MNLPQPTYRRASFYAKTVELSPHELPPPPNAVERVVDALTRAARDAGDISEDVAKVISDLLASVKHKRKAA